MTTTTRAALLHEVGAPLSVADVVLDDPLSGEVLVEVTASGVCHSDFNLARSDYGIPLPLLVGHEIAGRVLQVGPHVAELAPGDTVVAFSLPACGRCDECVIGSPIGCLRQSEASRAPGERPRITIDGRPVSQFVGLGGFAQHVLVHQNQLVKIDPRIPAAAAAVLGCGVATGAGAVIRNAEVRPLDSVVVIGAGGVGLNAIQMAALTGARKVIAVDIHQDKLALATTFGATHVVHGLEQDSVEAVRDLTDGRGVEHVFDMTGLPGPLHDAMRMLGRRGRMYAVGMQSPGTEFAVDLARSSFKPNQNMLVGSVMGGTNFRVDIPYYAELYLQGRLNLDDLVSKEIGIADVDAAFGDIETGAVARSVVTAF